MSLCILTSLHLNLPEHRKKHLQKYRKLGWMILGLVAPELVVWNAWEQRKEAKRLSALMEEEGFMPKRPNTWGHVCRWFAMAWNSIKVFLWVKAADYPEPKPQIRYNGHVHAWTDVHSWLVVMGGVAYEDTSTEDRQFMPRDRQRQPILPWVFEVMVKTHPQLIPDISREYIEDKSKSDWLAKGLTCWQAGYFCIQCVFRLSQQLSITLLELNVFAHAVCALLLFLVWWDKPRDVSEPTLVRGDEALDFCAARLYLYLTDLTLGCIHPLKAIMNPPPPDKCLHLTRPTSFVVNWSQPHNGLTLSHAEITTTVGVQRQEYLQVRDTYWQLESPTKGRQSRGITESFVVLASRDIERMARMYKTEKAAMFNRHANDSNRDTDELVFTAMLRRRDNDRTRRMGYSRTRVFHDERSRVPNWELAIEDFLLSGLTDSFTRLLQTDYGWITAGVTFAGAFYGGLHLIAWTSPFPSRTEMLLWRAASVTILAAGPSCAVVGLVSIGIRKLAQVKLAHVSWASTMLSGLLYFVMLFAIVSGLSAILWYIFCRVFIILECFILLAHIQKRLYMYRLGQRTYLASAKTEPLLSATHCLPRRIRTAHLYDMAPGKSWHPRQLNGIVGWYRQVVQWLIQAAFVRKYES